MSTQNEKPKVVISCKDQAIKLKEKYPSLTDYDLYFEQGKMEEMLTRLNSKVGISRHELYQMLTKR